MFALFFSLDALGRGYALAKFLAQRKLPACGPEKMVDMALKPCKTPFARTGANGMKNNTSGNPETSKIQNHQNNLKHNAKSKLH